MAARFVRNHRATRLFRERRGFEDLREDEILTRYRISKEGIMSLCHLLKNDLEKKTARSSPIPVLTQVDLDLYHIFSSKNYRGLIT